MFLVIYLLIYHLLIVLFLWSYVRTIFGSSRGPPREVILRRRRSFDCQMISLPSPVLRERDRR